MIILTPDVFWLPLSRARGEGQAKVLKSQHFCSFIQTRLPLQILAGGERAWDPAWGEGWLFLRCRGEGDGDRGQSGAPGVLKRMMQSGDTEQGALSVLKTRGVSRPLQFAGCLPSGPRALTQRQGATRVSIGSQRAGSMAGSRLLMGREA